MESRGKTASLWFQLGNTRPAPVMAFRTLLAAQTRWFSKWFGIASVTREGSPAIPGPHHRVAMCSSPEVIGR